MAHLDREDRPRIEERVGSALARGDLRQKETACDLDKLHALGAVGIEEKLADAVFRLKYANDAGAYEDALEGVRSLGRWLNIRYRWHAKGKRLRWMAKRVLHYWLSDNCMLCSGVGYEIVLGTPHLSDRACPACHGARKRMMPWVKRVPREPEGRRVTPEDIARWKKVAGRLIAYMGHHRSLLCELEEVERRVAAKVVQKLAQSVRTL